MIVVSDVRTRVLVLGLIAEDRDEQLLGLLGIVRLIMDVDHVPLANLVKAVMLKMRALSVNGKHGAGRRPKNVSDLLAVNEGTLSDLPVRIHDNGALALVRSLRTSLDDRVGEGFVARDLRDDIGNHDAEDHGNNVSRAAKRLKGERDRRDGRSGRSREKGRHAHDDKDHVIALVDQLQGDQRIGNEGRHHRAERQRRNENTAADTLVIGDDRKDRTNDKDEDHGVPDDLSVQKLLNERMSRTDKIHGKEAEKRRYREYNHKFHDKGHFSRPRFGKLLERPIKFRHQKRANAARGTDRDRRPKIAHGENVGNDEIHKADVHVEEKREIPVGDRAEKDGDGGDRKERGGKASVRLLQREENARKRRARRDGEAGASAPRHKIPLPGRSVFLQKARISLTDGSAHLNGRALVAERNAHEIGDQRGGAKREYALHPFHRNQASDGSNGSRDTAAPTFLGDRQDQRGEQAQHGGAEDQKR